MIILHKYVKIINMSILTKNSLHTVLIEAYTSEAYGVCHIDGRAVFVRGALPGECWEIKIIKITSSVVYARGERLLTPSMHRVSPDCEYYGRCGGCDTRHMSYEEELRFKRQRVNDALRHIGKQDFELTEILGADTVSRYRNKGIFAVASCEGEPAAGFFRERSHQLIPVTECLLQNALSERAATAVTAFMRLHALSPYDEQTGRGTVRHVFSRCAVNTDDAVVCVVSAKGFGALTQSLVDALRSACPELTGIVLNINRSRGNTVLAGDFYSLWGRADMRDVLCGFSFQIAPQAFFQINPPQAEKLYARAVEYALPSPAGLVFDLYCGAGTISLCLSRRAEKVIGAEIVPEAVHNAQENARLNGVDNVEFICADAGQAAKTFSERGLRPEVVVVDPPRKGMSEEAVAAVASMDPSRIVYVSCDPGTLARDVLRFSSAGYALQKATAVDMFPRTAHVETIVLLSHKSPDSVINVKVEFGEGEGRVPLDAVAERAKKYQSKPKITYKMIQEYVEKKYGLKVHTAYIAEVKRSLGLTMYDAPNTTEELRQPRKRPPKEKVEAITEALKYFEVI